MAADQGFFSDNGSSGIRSTNQAGTHGITHQVSESTGVGTLTAEDLVGGTVSISMDPNGDITVNPFTGFDLVPSSIRFGVVGSIKTATNGAYFLNAYDTMAASYTTFATLSSGNPPTMDLSDSVTKAGGYIYRAGGTDIPVADGGTGASTFTDHGVLVGSGTSPIDALAVGTTGQLLVGVTGADPAFASSAAADFSFTESSAGSARTLSVAHSDNTNTASNALVTTSVGGTSGGDAYHLFAIGSARSYAVGPDTSASQTLKINTDAAGTVSPSSGTNIWSMTSGGIRTMPLQPAFLAYVSSTITDVTGNAVYYTVVFDTEVFDRASNFNTGTGTFTAPAAGVYFLSTSILLGQIGAAHTTATCAIVTSNRTYESNYIYSFGAAGAAGNLTVQCTTLADMDAGDTATARVVVVASTQTVDVVGAAEPLSWFSGYLVA